MKHFRKELFKKAKGFRTTPSLESDISLIKKINNLITKLERNGVESKYKNEIINIFMILRNSFHFEEELKDIIKFKFIVVENHSSFEKLYFEFLNDLYK